MSSTFDKKKQLMCEQCLAYIHMNYYSLFQYYEYITFIYIYNT